MAAAPNGTRPLALLSTLPKTPSFYSPSRFPVRSAYGLSIPTERSSSFDRGSLSIDDRTRNRVSTETSCKKSSFRPMLWEPAGPRRDRADIAARVHMGLPTLGPSLRQISPTGVPASAWRSAIAICSSVNLLVFIRRSFMAPAPRGLVGPKPPVGRIPARTAPSPSVRRSTCPPRYPPCSCYPRARWRCSMRACGSIIKARRYYRRQRR
jgi:hypothetical protein